MKHYHQLMYMPTTKFPSWEDPNQAPFHQEPFGGFMWPPRSYTCTFCRREFRSAQALGGHMNVHRRDRARLKQSSPAENSPGRQLSSPPISADNDGVIVETKLSMGLDSVEVENVVCKRHKKSGSSDISLPWSYMNGKVCSSDRCSGGSSMEDIDLELRLGDAPAIKKEFSVIF